MKKNQNSNICNYLLLIIFIINIALGLQQYSTYTIEIHKNQSNLEIMSLNFDDYCKEWIPSLLIPFLLVNNKVPTESYSYQAANIILPFLWNSYVHEISIRFFNYTFLNKYQNVLLGKERFSDYLNNCYFGLSLGPNYTYYLNESNYLLNQLYNSKQINKKIFSFGKWNINQNSILTNFYFGDIHENFKSNKGNIGSCTNSEYPYWGCSFKEIIINNYDDRAISLEYEDEKYYKIYFATETNDIIFPEIFRGLFYYASKGKCKYYYYSEKYSLYCNDIEKKGYIPIKFINDNMNITGEIDILDRFNIESQTEKTIVTFDDINYIVLPLIMFKKFHIQFNGNNNIISFYTTDNSILEIRKKDKSNNKGLSKAVIAVIIISVILVISIIGFLIFVSLKLRKESNIKKAEKKIEEIQEFQKID